MLAADERALVGSECRQHRAPRVHVQRRAEALGEIAQAAVVDKEFAAAVGDMRGAGQGHRGLEAGAEAEGADGAGLGLVNGPFWPQPASNATAARAMTWRAMAAATLGSRRRMTNILPSMTATPAATPLSDAEYRAKTSAVLARIESTIDRWLQDDVIEIELNLVTNGGVTGDGAGPHTDYLSDFPYLGNPHNSSKRS